MSSSPLLAALLLTKQSGDEAEVLAEVNRVLTQGGVDVAAYTDEGESALHLAAQNGFAEVAAALVFSGCDVEARDNNGNTPLHDAALYGAVHVLVGLYKLNPVAS
jgi:ankyrin repeat protein